MRIVICAMSAILALSACTGGRSVELIDEDGDEDVLPDGVVTGQVAFDALILNYDDPGYVRYNITSFGATNPATMPTAGSVTYYGVAQVDVAPVAGTFDDGLSLLGDLTMRADFAASTITGDITHVAGYTGDLSVANAFTAPGRIAVGGDEGRSQIGDGGGDSVLEDPLPGNGWYTSYIGTLQSPMGELQVYGVMSGLFQRDELPLGLTGASDYASVVVDGVITNGTMTIYAGYAGQ